LFEAHEHELLDFGEGRRLERFGALVLDRPCPTAEGLAKGDAALWDRADAAFVRTEGKTGYWVLDRRVPERWTIRHGPVTLELKPTEFGHLGVFPEQAANWDWLAGQIRRARETHPSASASERTTRRDQSDPSDILPPLRVLNLFAYTGASTLAAAAAGAEVVHVDAARNVVAWARRNAELSGLADAPIRWIAEDATKFVKRELKRGNRYDAVILDPPSYGHGPRGEVWRLSKHLPRLLEMCAELTAGRRRFLLVTCHTPKFGPARLERLVSDTFGEGHTRGEHLVLKSSTGRDLPSGVVVRWEAGTDSGPHR
jgi:23S rRNA (cytosine1962-C5)-methyltransferase